jgi:CheY-like chemotaxis protein
LWLQTTAEIPATARQRADIELPAPARGTALLVDDEELVRLSIADMLTDLGFAVLEAASVEAARTIIEGDAPLDLLITDHLMPGMTGVDLAYLVHERRPNVPVLIISGFAEVKGIAPNLPRLTKPFRQADLAAMLTELRGVEAERLR